MSLAPALAALPAPVQWTVDRLIDGMQDLVRRAEAQRAAISMANAGVMDLDRRANAVADPVKRAEIKQAVKEAYRRQVEAASSYRTFTARFAELAERAQAWMREQGIERSTPTLRGLGFALPVVPVVVIGVYLTAVAIIGYLEKTTALNRRQLEGKVALVDRYLAGQITAEQFRAADQALDRTIDVTRPSDPFGFEALGKALLPIALIAGAVLLAPHFFRAFESRRAA